MELFWKFLRQKISQGRQAYVVYPLIEESEKVDAKSVKAEFERLKTILPEVRLGLLHGQLNGEEKERVMTAFRAGEIQVLVATSVIEVGVDVPNATIMLIENAERFGLAQLHQLRGRVGRGQHESFCALAGEPKSRESWQRLRIMEETNDGFRIAEADFDIRGPGNIFGTEQSGLPPLRFAKLNSDGGTPRAGARPGRPAGEGGPIARGLPRPAREDAGRRGRFARGRFLEVGTAVPCRP